MLTKNYLFKKPRVLKTDIKGNYFSKAPTDQVDS